MAQPAIRGNKPAQRLATPLNNRLIRLREVLRLTAIGRATLYRAMNSGQFPRSIKIGTNSVAWLESEVMAWIAARVDERNNAGGA